MIVNLTRICKFILSITTAVMLSACVTMQGQYISCEQKYNKIAQIVCCIKHEINIDQRYRNGTNYQYSEQFTSYADILVTQVNNKKISENKARALLSDKLKNLNYSVLYHHCREFTSANVTSAGGTVATVNVTSSISNSTYNQIYTNEPPPK